MKLNVTQNADIIKVNMFYFIYFPHTVSEFINDNTNSKPHEQPSSPLF
jgi:hypothetical protein